MVGRIGAGLDEEQSSPVSEAVYTLLRHLLYIILSMSSERGQPTHYSTKTAIPRLLCYIIDTVPVSACTGGDVDAVAIAGQMEGL
jgi:hypothetical protein